MNQSTPTSCSDSPINAYYNNATATPDQSSVALSGSLLGPFLAYAIAGGIASVFNIICIFIFVTKKELREKYILFAFLAFANLINTVFMFQAGTSRRYLIFTNQFMQLRSTFECMLFPGPHLQLLGGQLPALVLLVIDIERLIAVQRPMFYRVYITDRNRVFVVIGCCILVAISQLFGYLSSYMNRDLCTSAFCAVKNAFGLSYSNYNSAILILFPWFGLILNIFTYIGAQRLGDNANKKKELKLILVTVIITFVDAILIACPNVVFFGLYNNLWATSSNTLYLYVLYCCNSAVNLFAYICLKRDFRNHMLILISFGRLRKFLKMTNEVTATTRRIVPSSGNGVPINRSVPK